MRRTGPIAAVCLAVAALSTLLPWALAFDPEAWLVWGREAAHLQLATTGGPSWKPLPVLVTLLLWPLGPAAPWAWLVLARAAALAAVLGAAALAGRLTGSRAAALTAGALLALSPWWAFNGALGNSEGLLVAALLWAVHAHLERRHRRALALVLAAGLLRPETWPFLALYGAWLWRAAPALRREIAAALVAVPVAWCVPELLSSGRPFRAADAARGPASVGSAALEDHPAWAVARNAVTLATVPVALAFAGAVGAALLAARRAGRRAAADPVVLLAAAVLAWVALVAAMTVAGFAGNPRYSAPAAGLAAVLAGCAVARLPRRAAAAGAVALVVVVAGLQAGPLDDQRADVARRADLREQLGALVDRAGGAQALRACGPIRAYGPTTTAVAWRLDVALEHLPDPAPPGAVAFRARDRSGGPLAPALDRAGLAALPRAAGTRDWELRTACRLP